MPLIYEGIKQEEEVFAKAMRSVGARGERAQRACQAISSVGGRLPRPPSITGTLDLLHAEASRGVQCALYVLGTMGRVIREWGRGGLVVTSTFITSPHVS